MVSIFIKHFPEKSRNKNDAIYYILSIIFFKTGGIYIGLGDSLKSEIIRNKSGDVFVIFIRNKGEYCELNKDDLLDYARNNKNQKFFAVDLDLRPDLQDATLGENTCLFIKGSERKVHTILRDLYGITSSN